ncbi:MAG TPA: DUF2795 domain-containing protein [Nitrososphaeraceae archaeon]|nr:DUF2795 domain-containing protein [Nitrososphaeraceae archaeon]
MRPNENEKTDQIPGAQNIGETSGVISEQGGIPGQRKEVNVEDYERVASLAQILKELDFPANKDKIINFVKTHVTDKTLLEKIEKIADKEYKNVSEITNEAGLVY